jgi:Kef-type K+ transport system membrane component KefB
MAQNLELFINVLVCMFVILVTSQLFGRLFVLLKQPRVIGEMFAGVFLGPTLLGYFFPSFTTAVFRPEMKPFLFVLSNFGLSFYMFLVGVELEESNSDKATLKSASWLSVFNILVPFAFGFVFGLFNMKAFGTSTSVQLQFSVFMGAALAITAFPMLARILQENGLVKTKIGTLSLMSASFQDAISWIFLSYVTATASNMGGANSLILTLGLTAVFLAANFLVLKPLLKKYFSKPGALEGERLVNSLVLIFGLVLLNSLVTDLIGLYSVFGGFISGLIIPKTARLTNLIVVRLSDIIKILFLPIFFAYSGLNANLRILGDLSFFVPAIVLLCLAFGSKYLSTLFVMRGSGYGWSDASAMGGLMNARGLMELIIANVGLMHGVINQQMYSILVLLAITSTLCAMPIYKLSKFRSTREAFRPVDTGKLTPALVVEEEQLAP